MAVNDKKITGLATATRFSAGDLMVVRKSDVGDDRKISYANVMRSIGNTAVKGFTAVQGEDVNKIILTPSTGVALDTYYDGMTISFVAPVTTTDVVQIKIAGLEYADFKNYSKVSTVALAQGEYVEAIFDDNDSKFYKTNNESQPNSSTEYSVGGTVNIIELSSMNALVKERYYDGMVINFLTKGDSTANVTVKVDGLAALPLKNQFSQQVNNLINDQLVTASYKALPNPHFVSYIVKDSYVTNDYIVSSTEITPDESSTTLNLTSADGAAKTRYYNAMSLIFTSPVDTKGVIYLNVDGLGNKILKDPDELDDSLENGEAIVAIYDGTKFVKRMFTTTEQIAPPVVDPVNPPPSNLVTVNVGPDREIKNITNAIQALRKSYGDDGGNRICTILLDANFIWSEQVSIIGTIDLRWIIIKTTVRVNAAVQWQLMVIGDGASSPTITIDILDNKSYGNLFFPQGARSILTIKDSSFVNSTRSRNTGFISGSYGILNMSNVTVDGLGAVITFTGTAKLTNCNFVNCVQSFGLFSGAVDFTSVTYSPASGSETVGLEIKIATGQLNSCNITSGRPVAANVTGSRVTFVDCSVKAPDPGGVGTVTQCLAVSGGSDVTLSGGDYRSTAGYAQQYNIHASGQGTYIRIQGSVLGGRIGTTGGVIV